jgi:hypothetical protein
MLTHLSDATIELEKESPNITVIAM